MGGERRGAFAREHLPRAFQLPAAWSKQLPPLAGSAWSCPPVHITCAMVNPPNRCYTDRHCPRYKKCCPTFCGRKCISGLPSLSYGRVSGAPPSCAHLPGVAEGGYSDGGSGQGAVSSCQSLPLSGWWGHRWPNVWAGVTLSTGPNLLLSLPFPSVSSCSQDRPRAFSASPCHPGTSQLPTPLLRLVLPNASSQIDGDSHQPVLRDHLGCSTTSLTAATRCYVPAARPLPLLPHCCFNK